MSAVVGKSFDTPDEQRTPANTTVDVVELPSGKVARTRFEPGWRWSEAIKPVAGTESCQVHHIGTLVSGEMEVEHTDGSRLHLNAGDAYEILPGHDAWVVGDEPAVGFEFEHAAAATFAANVDE